MAARNSMKDFFIVLLCFFAVSAANAQTPLAPPLMPSQEIVIGTTAELTTLNPLLAKTVTDKLVRALIHRPITTLTPDLESVCLLCDKLPSLENGLVKATPTAENGNLVTVTVRLPENAVWGDGTPLTAEDFYFTWQIAKKLLSQGIDLPFYREIHDITITNKKKFIISLSNNGYALYFLHSFYPLSAHADKAPSNSSYAEETRYQQTPFDVGLFAGPYRLIAKDAAHAVVVPNIAWWGSKKPLLQRITVRVFPHAEALQEALLKKQIDMILPPAGLNFDQAFEALKTSLDARRATIHLTPSTTLEHLVINLQNPLLQDRRVRRALFLSLDREKFNALAFQGNRFLSNGLTANKTHSQSAETKTFNPEKAMALLEEAGFKKGADGIRVNQTQQRLSFAFTTVRDDPAFTTLQQLIANAWREVGVETTLQSAPLRDLEQRVLPQRLFTGVALIRSTLPVPQAPVLFLASTTIPNTTNHYQGENYGGWQNEKADGLLAALAITIDPFAARQQYQALSTLYLENLPTLPLYFTPALSVLPTGFDGFTITSGDNPQTLEAENWFFAPSAMPPIKKEQEIF
jgi:peptide/nickel transport system substrate-binding protein